MQSGPKLLVDIEAFGTAEAREVAACNFKGFASCCSGSCTSPFPYESNPELRTQTGDKNISADNKSILHFPNSCGTNQG